MAQSYLPSKMVVEVQIMGIMSGRGLGRQSTKPAEAAWVWGRKEGKSNTLAVEQVLVTKNSCSSDGAAESGI